MDEFEAVSELATHTVFNQSVPLGALDLYASDAPLRQVLGRVAPEWVRRHMAELGAEIGRDEWFQRGALANAHPPALHAFDRFGRRIDRVDYHPAYHELMALAVGQGATAHAWEADTAGHLAHTAALYLYTQPEAGFCCPLVMTHSAVPALRREPSVAADWIPRILSRAYDPRDRPVTEKAGVTIGMAMTEKQGGSDVRANTTRATALNDQGFELTGHKWFCSAPMSDAFLTLAQTDAGLTCFLLPRWRPDGQRNRIFLQRLKAKCGNHANASAEVEYDRAWAQPVGEPGHGIATILEMVQQTRLDAATAPVGMMRQALVVACHHARNREVFGRSLIEQPLMRQVLADLAIEVEAGLVLVLRLAQAFDGAGHDDHLRQLARIGTAAVKFWTNKRAPQAIYEAMECLGGGGYVEESILPRLYREAPVNSIWEGSGNIMCLDVLRAMERAPQSVTAMLAELRQAQGQDPRFDAYVEQLEAMLADERDPEPRARALVEAMARAWQASLLLQHGDPAVAEGYCATRLQPAGSVYGGGISPLDADAILARVGP